MDLSGRTLNQKYSLIERIATSNMASVYRARQSGRAGNVAVKILHEHLTSNAVFKKRFELEAKVLLQLQHPHIVSLIDFDTAKVDNTEFVFLVMDFIQGGTLAQRIHSKYNLTMMEILTVMEQLFAALVYTHSESIAHRDIKPENVLFTDDNRAVLTDFGLARLVDTEGLTSATAITLGTPQYMAPEILLAKANYHHALVDIYSLGVVFYEMVTGKTPYLGSDTAVISQKLTNQSYPTPREVNSAIPVAVEKVILRALAYDPKDRYQSMAQFAAAVQPLRTQLQSSRDDSPAKNWLKFAVASIMVGSIALGTTFMVAERFSASDSSDDEVVSPTVQVSVGKPPITPTVAESSITPLSLDTPTIIPKVTVSQATSTPEVPLINATSALTMTATLTPVVILETVQPDNQATDSAIPSNTQSEASPTPNTQPAEAATPQPAPTAPDNPPPTRARPPVDNQHNDGGNNSSPQHGSSPKPPPDKK